MLTRCSFNYNRCVPLCPHSFSSRADNPKDAIYHITKQGDSVVGSSGNAPPSRSHEVLHLDVPANSVGVAFLEVEPYHRVQNILHRHRLLLWRTTRTTTKMSAVPYTCLFSVALHSHRPYGLLRTGSPGRPPRLSHRSWALRLTIAFI